MCVVGKVVGGGREVPLEEGYRAVDFEHTDLFCRMRYLTMEVRHLDDVTVREADGPDAGSGEVGRGGTSQAACSHDENRRLLQT